MIVLHTAYDDLPETDIRMACACFVRRGVNGPELAAIVEQQWRRWSDTHFGQPH